MKTFLAVYTGTPQKADEKWNKMSEAEQQERINQGMAAWGAWAQKYHHAIKDGGTPLGKTKRVDNKGISDIHNALTAYTIVEAESHEEAAKMFLDHPHFSIFPGDSVEIMECLPLPKG